MARRSRNRLSTGTFVSRQVVKDMIKGTISTFAEKKRFVVNTASTAASAAGAIVTLSQPIVQGDNLIQRTGDKITVVSIKMSAQFAANTANLQSSIRYILFYDTQANGVVPSVTDVLDSVSVIGAYNVTNSLKGRFHVLFDRVYPLCVGGTNQTTHIQHVFKKKIQVFYSDTTNVATANSRNALFALLITDASVNQPAYALTHELDYYDM